MCSNGLDIVLRAWLEHDRGRYFLTQSIVRYAEDRTFRDRRMIKQNGLDFGAVDVLAASQNHVLCPIDDEDEAVIVDSCDVAGSKPAVLDRLGGFRFAIEITPYDLRAAYAELTDLSNRNRFSVGIMHFVSKVGSAGPALAGLSTKKSAEFAVMTPQVSVIP